jgi:hypothetical protein
MLADEVSTKGVCLLPLLSPHSTSGIDRRRWRDSPARGCDLLPSLTGWFMRMSLQPPRTGVGSSTTGVGTPPTPGSLLPTEVAPDPTPGSLLPTEVTTDPTLGSLPPTEVTTDPTLGSLALTQVTTDPTLGSLPPTEVVTDPTLGSLVPT